LGVVEGGIEGLGGEGGGVDVVSNEAEGEDC